MHIRPGLRRFSLNALLVVISTVMAVLVIEVGVRIAGRGRPDLPAESAVDTFLTCDHDPLLGWIFPPDTSGSYPSGIYVTPVTTNSLGIRSGWIDAADSSTVRILVLGDSYAFGWAVPEEDAFPGMLELALEELYPERRIDIINAAVPGYGLYQQKVMYERIRRAVRVDAVISTFSLANDPIDDLRIARYLPGRLHEYSAEYRDPGSFLSRVTRASRLLTLLDQRTRAIQLSLINISPAALKASKRSLEGLMASCGDGGSDLLIAIVPRHSEISGSGGLKRSIARWMMRRPQNMVTAAARGHGVTVIDLHEVLSRVEEDEGAYLAGDVHWSPAGHRAVADTLARAVPLSWLE